MPNLYIFDKDSTLVTSASGAKFINQPDDQMLIPGTIELLDRLKADGSTIAIASNQGGVTAINPATGNPYKTLEDTIAEFRYCLQLCPQIEDAYFCPNFKGSHCWRVWSDCSEEHRIEYKPESFEVRGLNLLGEFRKPNPGMLILAMSHHADNREVVFVGDRPEDEQAAQAADIPFQWIWDVNPMYPQELRGR